MPRKSVQDPLVIKKEKMPKKSGSKTAQLLRGFKDILPAEQPYWEFIKKTADSFYKGYGFSRIDPPLLEEASLFIRSIGKQTDIVEKEMFSFVDQGQGTVVMRPEATPTTTPRRLALSNRASS